MEASKKSFMIGELKTKLEELINANLDIKTRKKLRSFVENLKNVVSNRDGLLEIVQQLEALHIIDVPDELMNTVIETVDSIIDDAEFWRDFITDLINSILELEKKVNEPGPGCFSLLASLITLFKSKK